MNITTQIVKVENKQQTVLLTFQVRVLNGAPYLIWKDPEADCLGTRVNGNYRNGRNDSGRSFLILQQCIIPYHSEK